MSMLATPPCSKLWSEVVLPEVRRLNRREEKGAHARGEESGGDDTKDGRAIAYVDEDIPLLSPAVTGWL
ncbi:hypothetical protein ACLOJK_038177 [Asimina triloba]